MAGDVNTQVYSTMELDDEQYDLVLLDTSECIEMEHSEPGQEQSADLPIPLELDLQDKGDSIYGLVELGSNESDMDDNVNTDNSRLQTESCCSQRCLDSFSQLELDSLRSLFKSKNRLEQRQFMLDQFAVAPLVSSTPSSHLSLNGKKVCRKAFVRIIGTSHARLAKVYTAWQAGVQKLTSHKRKPRCLSTKHTTMVAWLDAYAHRLGEKMPHINQIHLPHFLTKKAVYKIMKGMY